MITNAPQKICIVDDDGVPPELRGERGKAGPTDEPHVALHGRARGEPGITSGEAHAGVLPAERICRVAKPGDDLYSRTPGVLSASASRVRSIAEQCGR